MKETPMWVGITYLFYCVALLAIVMGGTMYAVFALGASAFWLLAAVGICLCGYTPARWHGLWTGVETDDEKETKDDDFS